MDVGLSVISERETEAWMMNMVTVCVCVCLPADGVNIPASCSRRLDGWDDKWIDEGTQLGQTEGWIIFYSIVWADHLEIGLDPCGYTLNLGKLGKKPPLTVDKWTTS